MADAELGEKRVDGAYLDAPPAADIPELGRLDVVGAIRHYDGQGAEAFQDNLSGPRSRKPLEDLLEDQTGGDDHLPRLQGVTQGLDFRQVGEDVPPESKGPHAGVD